MAFHVDAQMKGNVYYTTSNTDSSSSLTINRSVQAKSIKFTAVSCEDITSAGGNLSEEDKAMQRLWASVIIQAIVDATNGERTVQDKVARRQARAWFGAEVGTTAQNFEEVCLAANMEPERVRKFVLMYEGPPLTMQTLGRLRDSILTGETDAN